MAVSAARTAREIERSEFAGERQRRVDSAGANAVSSALVLADEPAQIGDNSGAEAPLETPSDTAVVETVAKPRLDPKNRDSATAQSLATMVEAIGSGTSEKCRRFRANVDGLEQFLLSDAADIRSRLESHLTLNSMIAEEIDRSSAAVDIMRRRHEEIAKAGK